MKKFLRYFIHITTVVTLMGVVLLIDDGEFDIYTAWFATAIVGASYYIENFSSKK